MTSLAERAAQLSPHAREVLARELMRAGTSFSPDSTVVEPVAVVGMGCRFPGGVSGPEGFWELLVNGVDAITEVPVDRWDADAYYDPDPLVPGRMMTKWGGFLSDVAGFDAEFFGISPREAAPMDPQHRILLEVAWEALENAGIPPDSLGGSRTGVMMGLSGWDYVLLGMDRKAEIEGYFTTGSPHCTAPGRISYLLGLRGPSVAVDTACSSSLVAVHLACQSLRLRESDLALAGGVQLHLFPACSIALSKMSALSPVGRCKTFDAGADGFVRGEGCGVVVLKRLADAVRDGDRVLAVVRGSAVNQDGRSNGLTAPNALAQRDAITDALRAADVAADTVSCIEAHGTGTALGDPIEFEALAQTYGRGEHPCALGSVKTNLGHLEAAAGIAGFIKAVLAVQHGDIPPSLHFSRWNPGIDASSTRFFVPTKTTPWPAGPGPRRAAMSAFGFSGTNAHVVVEQPPDPPRSAVAERLPEPAVTTLVVSGKTAARVGVWASVLAEWMQGAGAGVSLGDVAHALNHHRARHAKFGSVCAVDRSQAVAGLKALAAGRPAVGVVGPHEGPCGSGTVFVYSGRGSQWVGMGRRLLADEPAFAAAVAELEPVFVERAGFSLQQVLAGGEELVGIERIQPALVGMQLALTGLWRAYGVEPDVVIGHSLGEVAAAVVAGALSPAQGLWVTATRARLMAPLSGLGAMGLVELDAEATEALIADYPEVTLAVYASPRQSVIAGPPGVVDAVIAVVQHQDRFASRVNIEVAPHHPIMDPVLPQLRSALAGLAPSSPRIPIISTTYGDVDATPVFDGAHWAANLRNPVRFSQAIAAAGLDHSMFIEVSPHPLLTHAIGETLAGSHHHSLGTLRRDEHDTVTFHTNLNATHTSGPPQTAHPPEPHPVLPSTPWQHTEHWVSASGVTHNPDAHPLLGIGVTDPTSGKRIWETELGPDLLWLGDHCINEVCVLPGAAYAEIALAAMTDAFGDDESWMIRELCLDQVMHVTDKTVLVTTLTGDQELARVEMRTRSGASGWITHATAIPCRAEAAPAPVGIDGVDEAAVAVLDPEELYARLRSAGQQHGPAFRGIVGLTVSDSGVARAEVRLPSAAKGGSRRLLMHPVMVDIALQSLGATKLATELTAEKGDSQVVVVPVRLSGIRVYGDVTEGVCARGSLLPTDRPDRFAGRVVLTDAQGRARLVIDEVETAVLGAAGRADELSGALFTLRWEPVALDRDVGDGGAVLVIADGGGDDRLLAAVGSSLGERTAYCQVVSPDDKEALGAAIARTDIGWDAIVVLCAPRAVDESLPDQAQLDLAQARTLLVADIVKAVTRRGPRDSPRLWIITRGAQQVDPGAAVTLTQTPLRGLARVLTFEHPELKTTVVDLDAEGAASAAGLLEELLAGAEHDEVALRDGQRYVNRLVPAPTTAAGQLEIEARATVVDVNGGDAFQLQIDRPGRLDALSVHAVSPITPQGDQVQVRVVVAGLNFSDVLKAMGIYPGLAGSAPMVGTECVGVVTALGPQADSVRIGQRVIALGAGTFASHMTTPADLVVAIPDSLSDTHAATFGAAYLTAWYSLREVGRLAAGERVLIHSATGGVGLAAVAIAKMIGARVYTTAGSDAKRELLSTLGVEYVGDSRSVAFADDILERTDGAGVDVILNSLPGEAIRRGVQILAPGGRFVELGKKDVYADASLGLAALAKSCSFSVVDLDLNLRLQPKYYLRLLEDILAHAATGQLQPLPVTEFPLDNAFDAFRLMASGGHIGKILIRIPTHGRINAVAAPPPQPLVSPDGGYIIVGGMGGLGLVTAHWLAQQGAGMIVLNGRSAPTPDAQATIAQMTAQGTRVEVITGDIAAPDTAEQLIKAVDDAGLRLAGVLHSAMVLADEIVLNISESAATRVFTPKIHGNWRLHQATADRTLDWWLTFSSAASLVGSPGQGSYAAANSWVDALVTHRRSHGLPAIGINWGPWAEAGRAQFFADLGFSTLTNQQGLAAIQRILTADRAHTGVFNLDAKQYFQSFPDIAKSSLFAKLGPAATVEQHGDGRIRAELDALDADKRPARLAAAIADEIGAVLRTTEPIEHDQPMESVGLDSLMALELRNRLETSLGITLPAALVWAYPTITDLATALCEKLGYPTAQADGVGDRARQRAAARQDATARRKQGQPV
jgi:phthiocerol/phenolphthiocerol synthesis type-I polyketide synthase C